MYLEQLASVATADAALARTQFTFEILFHAIALTAELEAISKELEYAGPIGPALKRLDSGLSVDEFFIRPNSRAVNTPYWNVMHRVGWRTHVDSFAQPGERYVFDTPPLPSTMNWPEECVYQSSSSLVSKRLYGCSAVIGFLRRHPKLIPAELLAAHNAAKASARVERRSRGVDPEFCPNCGTTQTPYWRKCILTGVVMCNACALYAKAHGVSRPTSFWGRDGRGGVHPQGEGPEASAAGEASEDASFTSFNFS